jgi:hypothetical protein
MGVHWGGGKEARATVGLFVCGREPGDRKDLGEVLCVEIGEDDW